MKKIFIACPVSKYISKNQFVNNDFKIFIESLYKICEKFTLEVFLALKREEYGKKLMRETCTELDFEEMKSADLVVAIPEDSKGAAVELGWASYMKKEIILLLDKNQYYTPLISGLNNITNTSIVWYDKTLDNEVLSKLDKAITKQIKE